MVKDEYERELKDIITGHFKVSEAFPQEELCPYISKARGAYRLVFEVIELEKSQATKRKEDEVDTDREKNLWAPKSSSKSRRAGPGSTSGCRHAQ